MPVLRWENYTIPRDAARDNLQVTPLSLISLFKVCKPLLTIEFLFILYFLKILQIMEYRAKR